MHSQGFIWSTSFVPRLMLYTTWLTHTHTPYNAQPGLHLVHLLCAQTDVVHHLVNTHTHTPYNAQPGLHLVHLLCAQTDVVHHLVNTHTHHTMHSQGFIWSTSFVPRLMLYTTWLTHTHTIQCTARASSGPPPLCPD